MRPQAPGSKRWRWSRHGSLLFSWGSFFEDASVDVVLSAFGCMFVPDHKRAASEIARVLRPDGRIGIASWTPEGLDGAIRDDCRAIRAGAAERLQAPILCGSESHVRDLFAGTGVDPQFAREETKNMALDSAEKGVWVKSGAATPLKASAKRENETPSSPELCAKAT